MDFPETAGFSPEQLKGTNPDLNLLGISAYSTLRERAQEPVHDINTKPNLGGGLQELIQANGDQLASQNAGAIDALPNGSTSSSKPYNTVATPMPVAIIGMSCRFPGGADNISKFWDLIVDGKAAWSEIPKDKFNAAAYYHPSHTRRDATNIAGGHWLPQATLERFDAAFFKVSPNEANAMDPRQRLHLEGAYEALENAGITLADLKGSKTSVFVGTFGTEYGTLAQLDPLCEPTYAATGRGESLIANRISYCFDLRGPSMVLDTACSSSLTAVHLACQSIRMQESNMAIVSGANCMMTPDAPSLLSTLQFLSPDGRSYMFDDRANGYGRGEGIGTVVLKPLAQALQDKDLVYAVIRNTMSNQDGKTAGITLPNESAQQSLIAEAYAEAGLNVHETAFFEAHGTGTRAGDLAEASAISKAMKTVKRNSLDPLYVGSVKTLVGHTEAAAGVAGIMKAALSLKHQIIPANDNFATPSSRIPLTEWRLQVPTELVDWRSSGPRRASVNGFGYGGQNVHVILEEARACELQTQQVANGTSKFTESPLEEDVPRLLCLSADDEAGVERVAKRLEDYLSKKERAGQLPAVQQLLHTLQNRRSQHVWRSAAVIRSPQSISKILPSMPEPVKGQVCAESKMSKVNPKGGMMVVPLSIEACLPYLVDTQNGKVEIAVLLSPQSVTVSGELAAIDEVAQRLKEDGLVPRKLSVDMAYHCHHMRMLAPKYLERLENAKLQLQNQTCKFSSATFPYETVTADAKYWVSNLTLPVQFLEAVTNMSISPSDEFSDARADVVIDIGPNNSLQRPLTQIFKAPAFADVRPTYMPTLRRKMDASSAMLGLAGELWKIGYPIDLNQINGIDPKNTPNMLADLPPYPWDHSKGYWHQKRNAKNRRFREYARHDLLGILANESSDISMRWTNYLRLSEQPWMRNHVVNGSIIFAGGGFIAMAVEAAREKANLFRRDVQSYTLRQVSIARALVIPNTEDGIEISFELRPYNMSAISSSHTWDEFVICSHTSSRGASEHCRGLISTRLPANLPAPSEVQSRTCEAVALCKETLEVETMRERIRAVGLTLEHPFFSLSSMEVGYACSKVCIRVASEESFMPANAQSPHLITTTTMDSIFSSAFSAAIERGMIEAPFLPLFVGELSISKDFRNVPETALDSYGKAAWLGSGDVLLSGLVCEAETSTPVIQLNDFRMVMISASKTMDIQEIEKMNWRTKWTHDADFLTIDTAKDIFKHYHPNEADVAAAEQCEKAVWQVIKTFPPELDMLEVCEAQRHYFRWLKHHRASSWPIEHLAGFDLPSQDLEIMLNQMHESSLMGQLATRVARNLPSILSGATDPLSLLHEQDTLNRLYNDQVESRNTSTQVAVYVDVLAHKNPLLRILEVGAGSASTTKPVLDMLGGKNGAPRRYQEYVFTDISPGFFERARETLALWGETVSYKTFDVEKEPEAQGFGSGVYDVVIAANVIHATRSIANSLMNTRKLLKPSGRLILAENTSLEHITTQIVFGTLSGWWSGVDEGRFLTPQLTQQQWQTKLLEAGFTRIDAVGRDVEYDYSPNRIIVTSLADVSPQIPAKNLQIITTDAQGTSFVADLRARFSDKNVEVEHSNISDVRAIAKCCIFIDKRDGSLLETLTESDLEQLKLLFRDAQSVLWASFNTALDASNVDGALAVGFLRSMRAEKYGKKIVHLDLDTVSTEDLGTKADLITEICTRMEKAAQGGDGLETELKEEAGRLLIPRIVSEDYNDNVLQTAAHGADAEIRQLCEIKDPQCLRLGNLGLLETFEMVTNNDLLKKLKDDEVEIEVKAVGLNFRDLMVASGQTPDKNQYGLESSGIVSKVGHRVTDIAIGDRVCMAGTACFANYARAPRSAVMPMLSNMSFEVAASIPSVFSTAFQAIYRSARLEKGETILIHSAAGGTGQACIQYAQLVGAEIFVTVGTHEKRAFIHSRFGIPEDRILDSRSLTFASKIRTLTNGEGVDVVINSLAGDSLRETWRCMAMFGRFVELGKRDFQENGKLDMGPFSKSLTFISLGWDSFARLKPEYSASVGKEVMEMFAQGTLTPLDPITTFSITDVEKAFRHMQTGKHMGKIVVTVSPNDRFKIIPQPQTPPELPTEASYLIAGGLSGICGELAKFMVLTLKTKNLIVVSRSGLSKPEARILYDSLQGDRTRLAVVECDIGAKDLLSQKIADLHFPPVRGIIQGAMVLNDSVFENMTLERFHATLQGKYVGTRNLHELYSGRGQLDFFVMLSSCSGVIGNPSQTNYAAANTYQDALALHRRSRGLPGTSIALCTVRGSGWVARNRESTSKIEEIVGLSEEMSIEQIQELIKVAIRDGCCSEKIDQAVVDRSQLAVGLGARLPEEPRFSSVSACRPSQTLNSQIMAQQQGQKSLRSLIQGANNSAKLKDIVTDSLRAKLSRVLSQPVEKIKAGDTLSALGVDSLVAVEVRNWLRKETGTEVGVFDVLSNNGTIGVMADMVVKEQLGKVNMAQ
ncbi:MAG: hypothetical protein Q9225_006403 [Loekoesia sp. 1 TL-2023]